MGNTTTAGEPPEGGATHQKQPTPFAAHLEYDGNHDKADRLSNVCVRESRFATEELQERDDKILQATETAELREDESTPPLTDMEDDDEAPTGDFLEARDRLLDDETPETIAEYTKEMDRLFLSLHTSRLLEMKNHYGAEGIEYAPEALKTTVQRLQKEKYYLEERVIKPLQECAMACRDNNIYQSLDKNFRYELERVIGKCSRGGGFEPRHYDEDGMPMMLSEYTTMESDLDRRKDVVEVLGSRLNCLFGLTNLALYVI